MPLSASGGAATGDRSRSGESGVALVITLIMIAVITFLAITFLAIARRERGQVVTTLEQTTAQLASQTGIDRGIAELVARILATTNAFNFDLIVSTNLVSLTGFDPAAADARTNVNYEYTTAGTPLTGAQLLQNLNNLLFNPSAPVFITNKFTGSNDFRSYVDLDRDGRHTPNGLRPVTNELGQVVLTNSVIMSDNFTGDPEFIGILERPEFTHSPSNRFLSRFAYLIVPAGKTLDLNYIHNHAKPISGLLDGFTRNQGVAPWEINLAAGLRDLNTNAWATYQYRTGNIPSFGVAFDDARSIFRYRAGGNPLNLSSVQGLYGAAGATAFTTDGFDGYSAGPYMTDYRGLNLTTDADSLRTATAWSGSDNPSHFFTTQDLFDRTKVGLGVAAGVWTFYERMSNVLATAVSSYDRYTYYRLLAQLGTDSAPEPETKLNLNYVNVGGLKATNFVSWTDPDLKNGNVGRGIQPFNKTGAELFFNNALDRLVRAHSGGAFGGTGIPVFVGGSFVYSSSLHRQMQLAANIWDATTNRLYDARADSALPSVFRPQFERRANNDIYITNYVEELDTTLLASSIPIYLSSTNVASLVQPDSLIYGVPLVIGAKKGFPNLNELAVETVFQITRKVELRKSAKGGGNMIYQTNQMFVIGISNAFGVEFWNSYAKNYTRPVDISVVENFNVSLTNDYGFYLFTNLLAVANVGSNSWPGWSGTISDGSFVQPMRSNHVIVPDLAYRAAGNRFDARTSTFEEPSGFAFPRWGLIVTNLVRALIVDRATKRIVDYVQLVAPIPPHNFAEDLRQPETAEYFAGLWGVKTNPAPGGLLIGQPGIIQQIEISKGNDGQSGGGEWNSYGIGQAAGATKAQEIANFLAFFTPDNTAMYVDQQLQKAFYGTNAGLVANVPFTPARKFSIPVTLQANDPLVHYTAGDLVYLETSGILKNWTLTADNKGNSPTLENLKKLNSRYEPWGGSPQQTGTPNDFKTVLKDPGIITSDAWQFPTNKLPTAGWLGRIHRGTPWQTVYLKSSTLAAGGVKDEDWQKWTGNLDATDAKNTHPELDRGVFDLFTVAFSDNAARGQLPINQSGQAAWSAVMGGMVALTNQADDSALEGLVLGTPAPPAFFGPLFIDPAGFDPFTNAPVSRIVAAINDVRKTNYNGTFTRLGDVLAVPELTENSPFLNRSTATQDQKGLNDAVMEWLPQQMLSLLRVGEPRFVIYSYGQTLKPAAHSIQTSGGYFLMCTNYQITAEVVTRAVVKVVGSPDPRQTGNADPDKNYPPRTVVESFNILPPD
ncbi:MAG: hypothetical protein EXS35_11405 [Pedosphaera sp.]|nr:hypothetical protein [Pedosphaera sp.]